MAAPPLGRVAPGGRLWRIARLTIAFPVCNGERFLEQTISCVLGPSSLLLFSFVGRYQGLRKSHK